MTARLSIILVNYRRSADTVDCLASLRTSTFKDFHAYVVDNASGDDSILRVRHGFPEVTVLENPANIGFGGGNNVGIARAIADNAALILLLNNDTVVNPHTLAGLVAAMDSHPEAGVVGAKIHYYDQPNLLWFAGGVLHPDAGSVRHRGIKEQDTGQFDLLQPSDFITGCCLLFRREVYDRIGGLDSAYFAYYEDADFCLRARRAGFTILYEPAASLLHKVSSTSAWDSNVYLYFNLRNRLLFLRKNSSLPRTFLHLPSLLYFYLRQFVRLLFKWRNPAAARAAWWGLCDGLRGYTGSTGEGRLHMLRNTS